jgi:hypothetical protein
MRNQTLARIRHKLSSDENAELADLLDRGPRGSGRDEIETPDNARTWKLQTGEDSDDGREHADALLDMLHGKIPGDQYAELKAALAEIFPGVTEPPGGAMDDPPPFPGRPEPGGTMTGGNAWDTWRRGGGRLAGDAAKRFIAADAKLTRLDRARAGFERRFPNAARIGG